MLFIGIQFISGVMFGVEFIWEDNTMVIDVGIIRFVIQFAKNEEEE